MITNEKSLFHIPLFYAILVDWDLKWTEFHHAVPDYWVYPSSSLHTTKWSLFSRVVFLYHLHRAIVGFFHDVISVISLISSLISSFLTCWRSVCLTGQHNIFISVTWSFCFIFEVVAQYSAPYNITDLIVVYKSSPRSGTVFFCRIMYIIYI